MGIEQQLHATSLSSEADSRARHLVGAEFQASANICLGQFGKIFNDLCGGLPIRQQIQHILNRQPRPRHAGLAEPDVIINRDMRGEGDGLHGGYLAQVGNGANWGGRVAWAGYIERAVMLAIRRGEGLVIDENDLEFELPEDLIPNYPIASEVNWADCTKAGDYVPIMFDWYRWVGNCCTVVAFIKPNSHDFAKIPAPEYHLFSGLLARCSKLMLSIIALTHKGEFGEAASIIHRSLTETAIKLLWLCEADQGNRARRLMADGLRTELEFESLINANIDDTGNAATPLETRMLGSIERMFVASEMTRQEIVKIKKLPNLAAMMGSIGWPRLQYVILQRIGSHAVHGTWPNLLTDYLTESDVDGFRFMPSGDPVSMHINQYMMGARLVLMATSAYVQYCLANPAGGEFAGMLDEAHDHLMDDYWKATNLLES